MFECLVRVDDKNVPKLMWALDGIAVGQPQWRPIRAAKATKKGVKSTLPIPNGSMADNAMAYIIQMGWENITTTQFREACVVAGATPPQFNGVQSQLRRQGFLGKPKKLAHHMFSYKVLKAPTKEG